MNLDMIFAGPGGAAVGGGLGVVLTLLGLYLKTRYLPASKTPVIDALGSALVDYLRATHRANTATPPAPPPVPTDAKVQSELGALLPFLLQLAQKGGAGGSAPAATGPQK